MSLDGTVRYIARAYWDRGYRVRSMKDFTARPSRPGGPLPSSSSAALRPLELAPTRIKLGRPIGVARAITIEAIPEVHPTGPKMNWVCGTRANSGLIAFRDSEALG